MTRLLQAFGFLDPEGKVSKVIIKIKPNHTNFSPLLAKGKFGQNCQISLCKIAPRYRNAVEISLEWSHHRISSTDSKVRIALQNFIIPSDSDKDLKLSTFNTSMWTRSLRIVRYFRYYMKTHKGLIGNKDEAPTNTGTRLYHLRSHKRSINFI